METWSHTLIMSLTSQLFPVLYNFNWPFLWFKKIYIRTTINDYFLANNILFSNHFLTVKMFQL